MSKKYIFVTGGVTSSLGKGIISASLGLLLKSVGYKVTIQKFDPYLNIDPGTMNPYEHGECYVTKDGAETDLDLGHYERFLDIITSQDNNVTTGRIYNNVIKKEREGKFLGKTVQVIPHITDEIKNGFFKIGKNNDFEIIITEIGGCIGDIESLPFFEAVRQAKQDLKKDDFLSIHLTLIPYLAASGELKTKPTQHSVKTLLEAGIQPDILVCRTEHHLGSDIKRKVARFCNVEREAVIESMDASTIYEVPLLMQKEGLDKIVLKKLGLEDNTEVKLEKWNEFLTNFQNPKQEITIGLVGKYVELQDAYKSISEAIIHAGAKNSCKVKVNWIHAEEINNTNAAEKLAGLKGVLVAPGFGDRGMEGKIATIKHLRENNIPFFGICLGMQSAVIEYSRNVLGLKDANSTEMNPDTSDPVINLMAEQKEIIEKGGTMRLGAYDCQLTKGFNAYNAYQNTEISERHRHRFEFNNNYKEELENSGLVATGINPKTNLVEIVEVPTHPWFVGVQFHPEYKSTVANPHPLFCGFIEACINKK